MLLTNDHGPPVPPTSALSCAALGWRVRFDGVCGKSKVGGECHVDVSFSAGRQVCEGTGGRLCTSTELYGGAAVGSGCMLDFERVWTGEACLTAEGGVGHLAAYGSSKVSGPPECVGDADGRRPVRCCAISFQ